MEQNIEKLLKEARTYWPNFVELEPIILQIVKKDSHIGLHEAYTKAYAFFYKTTWSKATINSKIPLTWDPDYPNKVAPTYFYYPPLSTEPIMEASMMAAPPTPPPSAIPKTMWNFKEVQLDVIARLQKESRAFGYHLCLGGGVLNSGKSDKDLDLYYLPLNNDKPRNTKGLIHSLLKYYDNPEPIGKDHEYPSNGVPYIAKIKFWTRHNPTKRIDVFILGGPEDIIDVEETLESVAVLVVKLEQDRIVRA